MPKVIGGGFQVGCSNCGSQLEFTRDEVKAGSVLPHDPDRDHDSVITCPKCRRPVRVTSIVGRTSAEAARRQADEEDRFDL